ncbi:MAG: hypothetical protein R2909_07360 [Gemmatimonadales bacterium]
MTGVVGGLTHAEVLRRFDAIVDFAGVEDFIDSPLRTYSSGMRMRLAFSVAIHLEPEVLLVDEVLAVGDVTFQQQCLERIARQKLAGCSIVLISHEASLIRELCDEALWLSHGETRALGPASGGRPVPRRDGAGGGERPKEPGPPVHAPSGASEVPVTADRLGTGELRIDEARLLGEAGEPLAELWSSRSLRVE